MPELGYGKAVHHVLREVAEFVGRRKRVPNVHELDRLFDDGFYLPAANRFAYAEMRNQARKLVDRYVADWEDDLHRVWEVERPFELHLGAVTVIGRADVIIDHSDGEERLSIVDYKTATGDGEQHGFQLQVYSDAGRREGLTVERAFVHGYARSRSSRTLKRSAARVATSSCSAENGSTGARKSTRRARCLRTFGFGRRPGCHGGDHLTPVEKCFDPWALARPHPTGSLYLLLGSCCGADHRAGDLTLGSCEVKLTDTWCEVYDAVMFEADTPLEWATVDDKAGRILHL